MGENPTQKCKRKIEKNWADSRKEGKKGRIHKRRKEEFMKRRKEEKQEMKRESIQIALGSISDRG